MTLFGSEIILIVCFGPKLAGDPVAGFGQDRTLRGKAEFDLTSINLTAKSMISIGAVYRGPELSGSPFQQAVRAAAKLLNAARGELKLGAVPMVNAVFVVPGSLGGTGFEGLNFGQYSRKDKAVVVQISVPLQVVQSVSAGFIKGALHGANAMAFEFFRQKGESFPLRDAEALVELLAPNRN